jgi:hypothetical protein
MYRIILIFAGLFFVSRTVCGEVYPSAETLVESLRKYDFVMDYEGLGHLLTIEEPRQPSMAANIVKPGSIEDVQILWKSDRVALAWLTARPLTDSTLTETGALLLLQGGETGWSIRSRIRFEAIGKYADIRFEFTGDKLASTEMPPVFVTVLTSNGGRGGSFQASETYELLRVEYGAYRLDRVELGNSPSR